MRKMIYKACQKLYFKKLLPKFIWSPVYDHWHRLFKDGGQWL